MNVGMPLNIEIEVVYLILMIYIISNIDYFNRITRFQITIPIFIKILCSNTAKYFQVVVTSFKSINIYFFTYQSHIAFRHLSLSLLFSLSLSLSLYIYIYIYSMVFQKVKSLTQKREQ